MTALKPKRKRKTVRYSWYYPLFDHMVTEHGLVLLDSELEDIRQVVMKMGNREKPV